MIPHTDPVIDAPENGRAGVTKAGSEADPTQGEIVLDSWEPSDPHEAELDFTQLPIGEAHAED